MKFDTEQLLKYIGACTSPYHTADTSLQMLLDSGFTELSLEDEWQLDSGSYVVNVFGTTLFAFHIGKKPEHTLRIASAHTDFPAIRVKPYNLYERIHKVKCRNVWRSYRKYMA